MPTTPEPAMPPAATRFGLPLFGLYGEPVVPGQELLHIEEVRSRSRLYQWEIEPHVHRGLYQVLWVRRGEVDAVVDDWRGHHLSPPPRGYHWVQTGGDYVLVAIATGVIMQILLSH